MKNSLSFVDKPLSNYDLMKFKMIRDNLPKKIIKEVRIINFDDNNGPDTHWVCYRSLEPNYCEFFDPFGLEMPTKIEKYLSRGLLSPYDFICRCFMWILVFILFE